MDLRVVNDASRRSKMGDLSGRCIPGAPSRRRPCAWLSSTRGARIRRRFSRSGERRPKEAVGSGSGTGWEGVTARDQAIWNRSNDRAGDRGGARAVIIGYGSASPMRPAATNCHGRSEGSPGSRAWRLSYMQRVLDRADQPGARDTYLAVLPSGSTTPSGSRRNDFAARYLAYTNPCQRFANALADVHA